MIGRRTSTTHIQFRLTLLSGNHVVLVEANGFDAEVFIPQIINGRICFMNIVPNRRCCTMAQRQAEKIIHGSFSERRPNNHSSLTQPKRMLAGSEKAPPPSPASNSISSSAIPVKKRCLPAPGKENIPPKTPDLARYTVPSTSEVNDATLVQIPAGIKVMRLYRDHEAKFSKSQPIHLSPSPGPKTPRDAFFNVSSVELPTTPQLTCPGRRPSLHHSVPMMSPTLPLKKPTVFPPRLSPSSPPWRKCITPSRTYSRLPPTGRSPPDAIRSPKVVPNYMVNPTKGPKPSHKVEIRKRKLIIDDKTLISPRTFKKQHKKDSPTSQKVRREVKMAYLPKNRILYELSKPAAFDLLTHPSRSKNLSLKLTKQFQKRCVNKGASTYTKLKLYCAKEKVGSASSAKKGRKVGDVKKRINSKSESLSGKLISELRQRNLTLTDISNTVKSLKKIRPN